MKVLFSFLLGYSLCITWLPLFGQSPKPYQAVVVDAVTKKAIADVSVQCSDGRKLITDKQGRYGLPMPMAVHLSCIGYAPQDIPQRTAVFVDTLRLLPAMVSLPEVTVTQKAQPIIVLSPQKKIRRGVSRGLPPGNQVAVVHLPPDTAQVYRIQGVRIYFDAPGPQTGRVRLRLATCQSNGAPSSNDFLPYNYVIGAANFRGQKDHLQIDLNDVPLLMPKEGIAIVLEGLPDTDNQQLVATTQGKDGNTVIMQTMQGVLESVQIKDYIMLTATTTHEDEPYRTWERIDIRKPWRMRQPVKGQTMSGGVVRMPAYNLRLELLVQLYQ